MILSFRKAWNSSAATEPREYKERDYLYASELGKPLVDRYLAMKGTQPTNPPNERAMRKMWAGNVWEFVAGLVLWQLGIVENKQQRVYTDGLIRVSGKLDYLISGRPNYDSARDTIKKLPFDDEMMGRFMRSIDLFEQEYGDCEFEETVHEIKSTSEYVIEMIGDGGNIIGHDLQIYHYLRGLHMKHGIIDYISRNDALMEERYITQSDDLKLKYDTEIANLKAYLDANEQPKGAPLIVWQSKFVKNIDVEWSNYLSLVYGFDNPQAFRDAVQPKVTRWNRVLGRVKDVAMGKVTEKGKKMELTDKNKEVVDEMQKEGYDVELLAARYKETVDE